MSPDQLYAVIARLLELNGLVESGQRVDAEFLSALQMPNRNGFKSEWD
jgi:cytochrome c